MKSVRADLSNDIKQLKIIPISDLHIGSPECNQAQVHSYIEQLKSEKDTYCILSGDLIENVIVGSVGVCLFLRFGETKISTNRGQSKLRKSIKCN